MTNPVAILSVVTDHGTEYKALTFICPGCAEDGSSGLHMLPVTDTAGKRPQWAFNGNLEAPTLNPSILTRTSIVCHSFLRAGVFEFLGDSTHSLAGTSVPMEPLPDWVMR